MTKVEYLRCQTCGMGWRRIDTHLKVESISNQPCQDCLQVVKAYQKWLRNRYAINAPSDEQIKSHSAMVQEVK